MQLLIYYKHTCFWLQSPHMWMCKLVNSKQQCMQVMAWRCYDMEMLFRITGPLCRETTSCQRIRLTKGQWCGLWCFLWCWPTPQMVEQTVKLPLIWDAIMLMWCHYSGLYACCSHADLGDFFDVSLNKWLNKQSSGHWFEMPWYSRDNTIMGYIPVAPI